MALHRSLVVRFVALGMLCFALGCNGTDAANDRQAFSTSNDSQCEPVVGPLPDAGALGHWFANDRRAKHTAFGRTPPDSSVVSQITDSAPVMKANASLDSLFIAMGGKNAARPWMSPRTEDARLLRSTSLNPDPAPINLYKAGSIYAVVPKDLKSCGGDVSSLPIVFFFDSAWRYLGERSL